MNLELLYPPRDPRKMEINISINSIVSPPEGQAHTSSLLTIIQLEEAILIQLEECTHLVKCSEEEMILVKFNKC
jgi:hypothetical protein